MLQWLRFPYPILKWSPLFVSGPGSYKRAQVLGSSSWIFVTHVGDQDGVLGCWFWLHPSLMVGRHLGNKPEDEISPSLSCSAFQANKQATTLTNAYNPFISGSGMLCT